MESNSKTALTSRFPTIKRVDVTSLKRYAALLGPIELGSFDRTYGNIRRLLQLEVQESAIAALSQFYDSEIRCFLFKNFQLSPTLEEYEQILGFSRSDVMPYQYQGKYYTDEKLASLLQVSVEKLKLQKLERNHVIGFPQEYFESLMKTYAETNNWGPFKQVLALTIFGIVLFPQIERYIDVTAIGVFLAFKDKENPINPVPAILADTYRAFTRHHEFQKKKIYCSLHVLYAWLVTHVVINKKEVKELISYALSCDVKTMNSHEWVQTLKNLDDHKVRWYTPACWKDRPLVIFQCGSFQNVPLMGTQGCINYNPSLTLRQLGYPMRNPPTEDMLFRFYLYEGSPKDDNLLRRILQAWEAVVRKGKEGLAKKTGDITFGQWLQKRIQSTQSPNQGVPSVEEEIPEPHIPTIEELDEIKLALSKAEEEKKVLQAELGKMILENKKLESENALKAMAIEEGNKRFKMEEKSKQEVQKYLRGAKEELKRCNSKVNEAMGKASEWKKLYEKSSMDEKAAKSSLAKSKRESRLLIAELEGQVKSIKENKESIEQILKEYQQALRREQGRSESLENHVQYLEGSYHRLKDESNYWESHFVELVNKLESHQVFIELKNEGLYWKDKFSKLAWLANQAIVDVPKHLRKAEAAMHPFNTPVKVYEFVEFCRTLTEELMEKAKGTASKKRERNGELKAICL